MNLAGRLDRHTLESPLLAHNPLRDPSRRECCVYVPPNYDGHTRYPVVMVLAGYGGTSHSLLNYSFTSENIVQRFDRLVRTGECPPALLVLPDAMNRWGGSQFLDSSASGAYQSYLADEIIPFVDQTYQTIAERSGRAIVGRSSGGFGALRMGLDRPELFACIGSHAGDSAFELSLRPATLEALIAFDRAGGVGAFAEAFLQAPGKHSFTAMMLLACAAAYAPEPDAPFPHVALPFDPHTGEHLDDVWQRYMACDPITLMRQRPDAFKDAHFVYLDAGDRDEHGLQFGARQMAALLKERGRNVLFEEFPGTHRGTTHRYERSLPLLIEGCASTFRSLAP